MARSIILMAMSVLLSACQTQVQKLDIAATETGQAKATMPRLVTPEACIAYVDLVVPKVGEKARWTQKRWEIVRDNRNRQADDCGATLEEYWDEIEKINAQQ
jgi:hypothetical protein